MVDIWIRGDYFIHQLARRVVITRAEKARAAHLRVDPHARLVNPAVLIHLVFHLALILDLSGAIRSVGGDGGRQGEFGPRGEVDQPAEYGEIDGRLYVSMWRIEGRDVQEVLAQGPLTSARAVRIIEQIAKATHAAHKIGLVHRDVKPSNILLDEDDFAYLIDFGIARALEDARLTSTGYTVGTVHYIAPERLGDHPTDDARADIYALTCVLYECLTARPRFAGSSMGSLVAAHLNTPPPQPSTTQPNVPPQLDKVIARGMAKDPDQRYATTVELADAAHDAIASRCPRRRSQNRAVRSGRSRADACCGVPALL